jgi:hypothetical protein
MVASEVNICDSAHAIAHTLWEVTVHGDSHEWSYVPQHKLPSTRACLFVVVNCLVEDHAQV